MPRLHRPTYEEVHHVDVVAYRDSSLQHGWDRAGEQAAVYHAFLGPEHHPAVELDINRLRVRAGWDWMITHVYCSCVDTMVELTSDADDPSSHTFSGPWLKAGEPLHRPVTFHEISLVTLWVSAIQPLHFSMAFRGAFMKRFREST